MRMDNYSELCANVEVKKCAESFIRLPPAKVLLWVGLWDLCCSTPLKIESNIVGVSISRL